MEFDDVTDTDTPDAADHDRASGALTRSVSTTSVRISRDEHDQFEWPVLDMAEYEFGQVGLHVWMCV